LKAFDFDLFSQSHTSRDEKSTNSAVHEEFQTKTNISKGKGKIKIKVSIRAQTAE
jgi:hypothetical protein